MNAQRGRRILISTDAVGGIWVYTLELAAALRAEYKVHLAVLGPVPHDKQKAAAENIGVDLHVTDLPMDWTAELPEELDHAKCVLAALAERLEVDIVQLHTPALVGATRWPTPVIAVVHSCVGTWWHAVRGSSAPPEDFLWRMAAVRAGLGAADIVIAPTQALSDAVGAVYATKRPIHVVNNARRALKIHESNEPVGVLAVGRLWDEAKNIALLDDAAGAMADVHVVAAGPTTGANGARIALRFVRGLGVLGQDDLAQAMGAARIFAAPALYEPFGLAVLEAAQAGRPLVLADIPTFRELWNGAAVFLPPRDAGAWAEALSALHGNTDKCRELGLRARMRAEDYRMKNFVQAMCATYQRLLAPPANASVA